MVLPSSRAMGRGAAGAAALAAAVFLLWACGEEERPADPGGAGGTRLEVEVRPKGPGGPVERRTVTDPPPGITASDFEPVSGDVACTGLYGGPATATVRGTLDGERIDAEFSRTDGCEIARWDAVEPLLGKVPGVQVPGP